MAKKLLEDLTCCDKPECDHCGCHECLVDADRDTVCLMCGRSQFQEARLALAQNRPGCPRDYQEDWVPETIGIPVNLCIRCFEYIYWAFINRTAKRGRGEISTVLRDRILSRDNHRCRYCGAEKNLQIDHIFPVIRGGPNEEWNLATACRKCNLKKRARTPKEAGMQLGEV